MAPDFIGALRAEEAQLEAALQQSPVFRRLEAVRESLRNLLRVYEGFEGMPEQPPATELPLRPAATRGARQGSTSGIVTEVAIDVLKSTGRRITSGQLLAILRQRGIKIENNKPQAQVASILSHNHLFDNQGDSHGSGYGLREWTEQEATKLLAASPAAERLSEARPGGVEHVVQRVLS